MADMVIRFGRYGLFVWLMWLWPIWFVADMVCGRYGTDPVDPTTSALFQVRVPVFPVLSSVLILALSVMDAVLMFGRPSCSWVG